MSGYVRNIAFKVPFDGQDVAVALKPLTRADLFKLQALLPRSEKDSTKLVVDPGQAQEAFDLYAACLPAYVIECDIKDAAGTAVPAEEWCSSAYFLQLVTGCLLEHMSRAMPTNP